MPHAAAEISTDPVEVTHFPHMAKVNNGPIISYPKIGSLVNYLNIYFHCIGHTLAHICINHRHKFPRWQCRWVRFQMCNINVKH